MRRRFSFTLLFISTLATSAAAQTPGIVRGAHSYHVYGTGEGAVMEPWIVQVTVRDTVVANKPAIALHVGSRLVGDQWRFNWWTLVTDTPPRASHTRYAGRSRMNEQACETKVSDNMIDVVTAGAPVRAGPFDAPIVHEYAVAHIVSGMQLEENKTLRLRVYRCEDAQASEAVRTWDLQAVVKSGEYARTSGAAPEPVWVVTGAAGYPYKVTIAKSDGMVLRFEVPQGPDSMVAEYRTSRR